jgi:tRNA (cmo5U34)-methyltransferase
MAAQYDGPGKIEIADAVTYPFGEFDIAILFLVLMFVPVPYRKPLIDRLRERTRPGGCIIIFDKLAVPKGYLGTVMHRLTIAGKVSTGVPADEIVQKELSLSGVQRPIAEGHLGLDGRFEFWRFGEFAGWIIESYG